MVLRRVSLNIGFLESPGPLQLYNLCFGIGGGFFMDSGVIALVTAEYQSRGADKLFTNREDGIWGNEMSLFMNHES